jgi:rod shape-determining protein MreD
MKLTQLVKNLIAMNIANLHPFARNVLNAVVIVISAGLCLLLSATRFPGMEILGVGPSWLVMWMVVWSLRRSMWHAATAGIVLGLIQDRMTFPDEIPLGTLPSHVLSLTVVGVLTVWLEKSRYIEDSPIPVSVAAFFLAIVCELVLGFQYLLDTASNRPLDIGFDSFNYLWIDRSVVILIAAVLSALWMPVIYFPLHLWWKRVFAAMKLV